MAHPRNLNLTASTPQERAAFAVGFIERRLPDHHDFFRDPPAQYDRETGRYVATSSLPAPNPNPSPNPPENPSTPGTAPERVANAMTYWNMIFPSAMSEFSQSSNPPKRRKPEFDIRIETTWIVVYDKLNTARDQYTRETGVAGRARRVWRWTADNTTETLQMGVKLVPQMDIVTPVLGAVTIILDAVQKGAEVRREALGAFDDLEDVFADVELFLGTFQKEAAVVKQAVSLVADVLLAVEKGIGFFTRSGCKYSL